jgi:hypothetical protein
LFFQIDAELARAVLLLELLVRRLDRLQKGHWKSLKITSVTGAVREPQIASFESVGTPACASLQVVPLSVTPSAVASSWPPLPPMPLRSIPHMRPIPARKQRRKPTMAVPLFIFRSSPHASREAFSPERAMRSRGSGPAARPLAARWTTNECAEADLHVRASKIAKLRETTVNLRLAGAGPRPRD